MNIIINIFTRFMFITRFCFSINMNNIIIFITRWMFIARLCLCNAPDTPADGRYSWRDLDWPHISILVFSAHFVLTHAHPGATSRSVTHPETTPS